MRFASYRLNSGKWICFCIVQRWRPLYDRMNQLLSGMEGLAHWAIVKQEEWDGLHQRGSRVEHLAETQGPL